MDKTRFALIGAGGIAQSYAQAFAACEDAQLVAVADVRPSAAEALAAPLGAAACDCYRNMTDVHAFDAVVICTPPNTHREISSYFLGRGIPVLCEKPLSIDSIGAQQMLDAARRSNTTLTMGSKFRYVEDVIRARSLIASGAIGEVVLFENAFTARVDMSRRWNSNPAVSGGGVLIDNGAHSVDIIRYFLGPIAQVQAVEGKRVQALAVEDTVRLFVRSTAGVMGNVDLSWSINKELDSYINVFGTEGSLSIGWKESKYRRTADKAWTVFGAGYNKVQAFRSQLQNFARSLRGEESLLITAEDALASVQVIEAAYASLRQQHWVTVTSSVKAAA